jgi:uncharacterized DUF497 family protein
MRFKDMEFEWDDGNSHKIRERFRPEEVEEFFLQELIFKPDTKHSDLEIREIAIGKSPEGKSMFVCFTIREGKIRVISARYMRLKEVEAYEEIKKEEG